MLLQMWVYMCMHIYRWRFTWKSVFHGKAGRAVYYLTRFGCAVVRTARVRGF